MPRNQRKRKCQGAWTPRESRLCSVCGVVPLVGTNVCSRCMVAPRKQVEPLPNVRPRTTNPQHVRSMEHRFANGCWNWQSAIYVPRKPHNDDVFVAFEEFKKTSGLNYHDAIVTMLRNSDAYRAWDSRCDPDDEPYKDGEPDDIGKPIPLPNF